ncbi:hypothetical protein FKM82_024952 [Ascaphus truei]
MAKKRPKPFFLFKCVLKFRPRVRNEPQNVGHSPPPKSLQSKCFTDVHHIDSTQPTAEKWSPTDTAISTLNSSQPLPVEEMESQMDSRTRVPGLDSAQTSIGMCEEEEVFPSSSKFHGDQVSSLDPSQHPPRLQVLPGDCMQVCRNAIGHRASDPECASVSQPAGEPLSHMASPPSPSSLSMGKS